VNVERNLLNTQAIGLTNLTCFPYFSLSYKYLLMTRK